MIRLLAAAGALALAFAVPAGARPQDDDRIDAYADGGFLLDSYARQHLLDDPAVLARFAEQGFAPACAAFMQTIRAHRDRYDAEFKPLLVAAVREIVPAETLIAAAGRPSMFVGGPLLPYGGRVRARLEIIAAPLYRRAAAEYRSTFDGKLAAQPVIAAPAAGDSRFGSDGTSAGVTMRCALWAADHHALIFPDQHTGDR